MVRAFPLLVSLAIGARAAAAGASAFLPAGRRRSPREASPAGGAAAAAAATLHRLGLMRVTVRVVGRRPTGGDAWLEAGVDTYRRRLERTVDLDTEWHRSEEALRKAMQADAARGHAVVVLDPTLGRDCSSEDFARQFLDWMRRGGSRVAFVIGGAEGLTDALLAEAAAHPKLSLSRLTFTHQFARLLLVEQVYRACEINRGSDYHK